MKKILLMFSVLALCSIMLASVSAFDFSIRGSSDVKTNSYSYQATTSMWHSDRAKGGAGSFSLTYSDSSILYRLNVNIDETNMVFVGNKAYGTVTATGTEWAKNLFMARVTDYNVNYVYDSDAKTITFTKASMPGKSITIPVVAYK